MVVETPPQCVINIAKSTSLQSIKNGVMITTVRLQFRKTHPLAIVPWRARTTDVGMDLASVEEATLPAGRTTIISTGLEVAAPPGFYYSIEGRSNLWKQGIFPNRGIIDATYCGPLVVSLVNTKAEPYEVHVGDRIAQLIMHRQYDVEFEEVMEFSPEYNQRGTRGFGSTGR